MLHSMIRGMVGMLLGATLLPLSAQVTDPKEPAWILNPDTVAADKPFTLEALSYRYSCAHTYTHQKMVVNGSRIDLSFLATANPTMLCPAVYKPYGPVFSMPALPAGRYTVATTLFMPCNVDTPVCLSMPPTETAGTLVVGDPDESISASYLIEPTTVLESKVEFTLNLLNPHFTCNLEYLLLSSSVQNGRITLTFLDKANPTVRCAPEKAAYGPAYKLRGLEVGVYEVWAARLPACAEQGCKMAPTLDSVGELTVVGTERDRKGWFLKQKQVAAGRPFTLSVVNNAYGNCQTGFANTSLTVGEKEISVYFSITSHPERVCVQDMRPHGPDFEVAAMRSGSYPVFVHVMPACLFDTPRCMIDVLIHGPSADDTLMVAPSQALALAGAGQAGSGPQAAWHDGALRLRLPAGAQGAWRAEVFDLSGRRLHGARFDSRRVAELRGFPAPDGGLMLVRLTGPGAGETHMLRVPAP